MLNNTKNFTKESVRIKNKDVVMRTNYNKNRNVVTGKDSRSYTQEGTNASRIFVIHDLFINNFFTKLLIMDVLF